MVDWLYAVTIQDARSVAEAAAQAEQAAASMMKISGGRLRGPLQLEVLAGGDDLFSPASYRFTAPIEMQKKD